MADATLFNVLDGATCLHLRQWADKECRNPEQAINDILAFLSLLDMEDAALTLGRDTWGKILEQAERYKENKAERANRPESTGWEGRHLYGEHGTPCRCYRCTGRRH